MWRFSSKYPTENLYSLLKLPLLSHMGGTFPPQWREQRENLKLLILRDCLWYFRLLKKMSVWIFTITGWLFSHTGHTSTTVFKHCIKVGPLLWKEQEKNTQIFKKHKIWNVTCFIQIYCLHTPLYQVYTVYYRFFLLLTHAFWIYGS